jgi:hypothetical protein
MSAESWKADTNLSRNDDGLVGQPTSEPWTLCATLARRDPIGPKRVGSEIHRPGSDHALERLHG